MRTKTRPIELTAVDFAVFETTKSVTVTTLNDADFEGLENFALVLFKNYSDYAGWVDGDDSKLASYGQAVWRTKRNRIRIHTP